MMKVFLITNKHMIGQYSLADPFIPFDSIIVNFYNKNGTIFKRTIPIKGNKNGLNPLIRMHPQNDIDIVAINITDIYNSNNKLKKTFALPSFLIPLDSVKSLTDLGIGSQVFAIGYPAGIASANTNKPIAKAGYISSVVTSQFQIDIPVKDRNNRISIMRPKAKIFLVDGLIIGGNSGGPVVNPQEPKFRVYNGKLEYTNNMPNYIIGIVSMGFENTGLSVIYSCDHILEIIAN
jgi:hypothetical protein